MPSIVPSLETAPRDSLRYLLAAGIVIAALYVGAEIFVPVALAILLSFVLAPGVRLLQRWRLGRVVPVIAMTLLAFLVIAALGGLLAEQLRDLANALPQYETTVLAKIEALRSMTAGAGTGRFSDFIASLADHLHAAQSPAATVAPVVSGTSLRPVPVVVQPPAEQPLDMLYRFLLPALHPLAMIAIVTLYVVFMLLQREDLRNRAIRLFGAGDLHRSTAAIDDAARRLSRYLLSQLAVNTLAGLVVGLGLWLIGVPSPVLWGVLFGCLRFVPYVGPPLAAIPPLLLAAAVAPGWSLLLWAAGLMAVVELTVGQAVEPLVYGHNTGLSPVAIVIAATFWTALWGPVGLVLSTPITVCLVVLGRHVEHLSFLDVMLGDRPPLAPAEVFYQRMLADDPIEASDHAERLLKETSLTVYYDDVLVPGLLLAQDDVTQDRLNLDRQRRIAASATEVVENLSEQDRPDQKDGPPQTLMARLGRERNEADQAPTAPASLEPELCALPEAWTTPGAVLCIGSRGPLDDAASAVLAQVLGRHGFGAEALSYEMLAKANIDRLPLDHVRLICLSCLDGSSAAYLRFILRRLGRHTVAVPILIGAWWRKGTAAETGPDPTAGYESVSTLAEAVGFAVRLASPAATNDAAAKPGDSSGKPPRPASLRGGIPPEGLAHVVDDEPHAR